MSVGVAMQVSWEHVSTLMLASGFQLKAEREMKCEAAANAPLSAAFLSVHICLHLPFVLNSFHIL